MTALKDIYKEPRALIAIALFLLAVGVHHWSGYAQPNGEADKALQSVSASQEKAIKGLNEVSQEKRDQLLQNNEIISFVALHSEEGRQSSRIAQFVSLLCLFLVIPVLGSGCSSKLNAEQESRASGDDA